MGGWEDTREWKGKRKAEREGKGDGEEDLEGSGVWGYDGCFTRVVVGLTSEVRKRIRKGLRKGVGARMRKEGCGERGSCALGVEKGEEGGMKLGLVSGIGSCIQCRQRNVESLSRRRLTVGLLLL